MKKNCYESPQCQSYEFQTEDVLLESRVDPIYGDESGAGMIHED